MEDSASNEPTLVINTQADTPSEAVIKAASKAVNITDKLGRVLTIRRLGAMAKMDLAAVLGAQASNEQVAGYGALAFSVSAIDGEVIFQPTTYEQLRALVDRLEDEGVEAAGDAALNAGWVVDPKQTATAAAGAAALKNS